MTPERIKSSEMIHEVSWHFQALLEIEKLVKFTEEPPSKQSNCLHVSQPWNQAGKCDIKLQHEYFESDVCGFLMWFGVFPAQLALFFTFPGVPGICCLRKTAVPSLTWTCILTQSSRNGFEHLHFKNKTRAVCAVESQHSIWEVAETGRSL